MKIADGIEMLEIPGELITGSCIVNPVIFWDDKEVLLVDAGFPNQVQIFREEFSKAGVPFERLSKIIITHSDIDHIGGLAGIIKELPQKITVLAHKNEKPYIETELLPIRLQQMEGMLGGLPEGMRKKTEELCKSLRAGYKSFKADVDRTVEDGEELPYLRGITVIYTPGHTPGHICLYHKESKTLIAGDMFSIEGGELVPAPSLMCLDKEQYDKSMKKVAMFDIETVVCYHGGLFRDNPKSRIEELVIK